MSLIEDVSLILHRIKVKLYPNYLKNVKGTYIARTNNERTLDTNDICITSKTRGGFTGNLKDMRQYVDWYLEEIIYQLLDGYAVTNGFFTIHPNVGGTFESAREAHNHEKHPISFRFTSRAKLRKLARAIEVDVEGMADTSGYIDQFTDTEEESTNGLYVPGNLFVLYGDKIKIAGDDSGIGVYFVPVDDPSKIIGIAPKTGCSQNRIEVRTQFSGASSNPLKTMRTITSSFTLEEA